MLHYKKFEDVPSGEWVIMVHGAGGSSNIWYKQLKEYRNKFNLLLVDLRGHGGSAAMATKFSAKDYSFESLADDVIATMDEVGISKAHFVGVSLGTLIIRQLATMTPERVSSMVLVGAITHMNFKSRFWVGLGRVFKNYLPYMWLYRLFAFVILPATTHAEARNVFIQEAQKLCQREFLRWYRLTGQLTSLFRKIDTDENQIPTLYVMGSEDYLFLEPIQKLLQKAHRTALYIVEKCGHVVNIEQPSVFNEVSVKFLLNPYQFMQDGFSQGTLPPQGKLNPD